MFPLTLYNLSFWLAVTSAILLVTAQFLNSAPKHAAYLRVDKKRLALAGVGCGLAFLVTIVLRLYTSPGFIP